MNGVDYYRDRRVNRSQYNRLTFWGKFWALHQAPGPLHVSSVREPSRLLILGRLLGI